MKIRLLSLLLGVLLLLNLVSCDTEKDPAPKGEKESKTATEKPFVPESAKELWDKINSVMEGLDSYYQRMECEGVFYMDGNKLESESGMKGVLSKKEGDFYEYTKVVNELECKELDYYERVENKKAYYDGKMYIKNKTDAVEQLLCAPVSVEDYQNDSEDNFFDDVDPADCTKQDFSKEEDGSWKLSFSGYTKKTMESILDGMEMDESELGAPVEDAVITVCADEKFRCKELKIEFIFTLEEDSTTAPEFLIDCTFDQFNEAIFDVEAYLPEEYTEVDDLLILEKFTDELTALQETKKGKFELNGTTEIKYQEKTEAVDRHYEVSYGEENGSYYFDLLMTSNEGSVQMNQRGGMLTYAMDGESDSEYQSDEDARDFIGGLIDYSYFMTEYVTDVEKTEDGVYLLKIDKLDKEMWSSLLDGDGIRFVSGSQELTVTMKDGKLCQYEFTILLLGRVQNGLNRESLSMVMTGTFVPEVVDDQKGA